MNLLRVVCCKNVMEQFVASFAYILSQNLHFWVKILKITGHYFKNKECKQYILIKFVCRILHDNI
jgi:hypothetical protein